MKPGITRHFRMESASAVPTRKVLVPTTARSAAAPPAKSPERSTTSVTGESWSQMGLKSMS